MKEEIKNLIADAINQLQTEQQLPTELSINIQVEHTRDKQHGDFASNIALLLSKPSQQPPRKLAELITSRLATVEFVNKVEIAGPGFINFYLNNSIRSMVIHEILAAGRNYGRSALGKQKKINLEFVSANPTGPLHVGHGRSVAFGSTCANLLAAVGFDVHREYYVNDAGRQMNILSTSIWLRYLEMCGEQFTFPTNGYRGDYIIPIAQQLHDQHGDAFHWPVATVFNDIPADANEQGEGDKEAHINGLIERAQELLGEAGFKVVLDHGLTTILEDIRDDLEQFGLTYQEWFSERSLFADNTVDECIARLKAKGHTYTEAGNLWFKATTFGDDKDRVLVRKNGQPTYFAADIAYHVSKFKRGAEQLIDIVGADHHGYVGRVRAALTALDMPIDDLNVLIVQFATLYRGNQKVQMSTRSGSFVTLRELREEVGKDAARFFYVLRRVEQHLDFDLELAKSQSNENPVYYIQYAHARICSVMQQLHDKKLVWDQKSGLENLDLLLEPQEQTLLENLARYPEMIQSAALNFSPHLVAHYLRDLANNFHSYYNAHQFLIDNNEVRNARLCLVAATQNVIVNGLELLGVSAPEAM